MLRRLSAVAPAPGTLAPYACAAASAASAASPPAPSAFSAFAVARQLAQTQVAAQVVACPAVPSAAPPGAPATAQASHLPQAAAAAAVAQPAGSPAGLPLPRLPECLTWGLPDLGTIEAERADRARALKAQVRQGEELLREQQGRQTKQLHEAAEALKSSIRTSPWKENIVWQIDQLEKQQGFELNQKYSDQLATLQKTFQVEKHALETKARTLSADFQQRRLQEKEMEQQYHAQKAQCDYLMRTSPAALQTRQAMRRSRSAAAVMHMEARRQRSACC